MSRIILSRYDDGSTQLVIGWDHPAQGAFWMEYASRTEQREAQQRFQEWQKDPDADDLDDDEVMRLERIIDTEVKREDGMWPGIPLEDFQESVPEEYGPLLTDEIMQLLHRHAQDPDSGYHTREIDLTR